MGTAERHNVYVIELERKVLENKKFAEANPAYREGMPCLYVGMTGLSPEKRWTNHQAGIKSSKYPREFGIGLLPDMYEHLNPMSFADAQAMEEKLAMRLREKGYAVWQA